jgi:hypothetical protein
MSSSLPAPIPESAPPTDLENYMTSGNLAELLQTLAQALPPFAQQLAGQSSQRSQLDARERERERERERDRERDWEKERERYLSRGISPVGDRYMDRDRDSREREGRDSRERDRERKRESDKYRSSSSDFRPKERERAPFDTRDRASESGRDSRERDRRGRPAGEGDDYCDYEYAGEFEDMTRDVMRKLREDFQRMRDAARGLIHDQLRSLRP